MRLPQLICVLHVINKKILKKEELQSSTPSPGFAKKVLLGTLPGDKGLSYKKVHIVTEDERDTSSDFNRVDGWNKELH